jgi:uncharacterized protein YcfL
MKTTNTRRIALAAVLLAGALLPGCTSGPLGTATNTYTGDATGEEEQFVGDRDLAAKFVLLNIRTDSSAEFMRVQFDLKNTTPGDLRIEWAIDWKDQAGFSLDTNPHWRPAVVTGQGFHEIQATAPMPGAKIFRLMLRKPTPIKN